MRTLQEAINRLGWDAAQFPNLTESFARSESNIQMARNDLRGRLDADSSSFDIVAFGSLARYEMTTESDLDYLVVAYMLDEAPGSARKGLDLADNLRELMGQDGQAIRPPGATGIFGRMVSATDLVEVIGLEGDTNHSHTRRILLLEESVSLFDPDKHARLIDVMVRRYLEAKPLGERHVPRFLLNDLSRYWRTLTIDYQAKTSTASAYSLRYLKLILSRKFTYASSILPLLALGIDRGDESDLALHLASVFRSPPVIRFLDAAHTLIAEAPDLDLPLKNILMTIDDFNGRLGRKDWRSQIGEDSRSGDVKGQPTFSDARELGRRLQVDLEHIFFHELLSPLTRDYLVF